MTDERRLVYIHKLLHEKAKHKQGDLKELQTEQVKCMKELLGLLEIEDSFAAFVKDQNPEFLAAEPNTSPSAEEIDALQAMGITVLSFPCIRIAENGKSARGMWLAETKDGAKPIAAEFLNWDGVWKLWKLILAPTTDNLPADPYERCYPDPKEEPTEKHAFGGPGGSSMDGPPPMDGPGGPPMGGPPPGGPGGKDQPPFDPDARPDVFDIEENYTRLNKDIGMLSNLALPDYKRQSTEADRLMERCRKIVSPEYATQVVHRSLL